MDKTDWSATITVTYLGHEYTRKVPQGIEDCGSFCDAVEDILAAIYKDTSTKLKIVEAEDG